MDIDLSTDTAPKPEHTIQLAETMAAIVRTLNHQTRHHEALRYPAEADRLIREVSSAVSRLDQLLAQTSGWLDRERQDGRVEVTGGPHAGNPAEAVITARLGLDWARTHLGEAVTALEAAASVTSCLAAREDSTDEH